MLPRNRKQPFESLTKDDQVVHLLKRQNQMLYVIIGLFVVFVGAIILLGISLVVSAWLIYSKVDVMNFNHAVNEVKSLTKLAHEEYSSVRMALPKDMTKVTREALFGDENSEEEEEERLKKLIGHWSNGITGASHVLSRMFELDFIGYSTPLINRLADAAVTDQAAIGAESFGEIVNYVGRHARDKTLDQVFGSTKDLIGMTEAFFKDEKTQSMIKQMEESRAIERTSNATAAVMESISSVKFNGTEIGRAVEGILSEANHVIQKLNEGSSFVEFRDAFYSLAASTEVLVYDGINVGGSSRARSPTYGRIAIDRIPAA